jgi:uncharacterized membrane protein
MEERPKISIKHSVTDKFIEGISWIIFATLWILTIRYYSVLPDIIPKHFNASGQVDDFGSKAFILTLPIIGSIIFLGISFLTTIPHRFNYPTTITRDNAEKQYKNAFRTMVYLKFIILLSFIFIQYKTIQISLKNSEGLGLWFLPAFLALILIPLSYFVIKAIKMK